MRAGNLLLLMLYFVVAVFKKVKLELKKVVDASPLRRVDATAADLGTRPSSTAGAPDEQRLGQSPRRDARERLPLGTRLGLR